MTHLGVVGSKDVRRRRCWRGEGGLISNARVAEAKVKKDSLGRMGCSQATKGVMLASPTVFVEVTRRAGARAKAGG